MKKEEKSPKKKGNIYDRIFKENARELFLPLVEKRLGIEIISYEALPEKVQKTTEREADFLYKVKTRNKKVFLLHIEFQKENDPNMLQRMAEYHGLFFRTYNLPIRHVVVYLGKRKATMKSSLDDDKIFKGFDLISIYDIDKNEFLSAQTPPVIMLALLTNFGKEKQEAILRLILMKVKKYTKYEKDLKKYLEQLLILARIRNLESLTGKIISSMPLTYDIKKDGLYKKGKAEGKVEGQAEGMEKGEIKGIERTLKVIQYLKEGKTIEEIAKLTELTESQIEKIKTQIS